MATYRNSRIDAVIDVRSRVEYFFGHLPGSECIPLGGLEHAMSERRDLTPDSAILLVCASGARSASAADILRGLGYRRVVDGGAYAAARPHYDEG
ncbi:MAG: rhodanese-like domain-containing protein [Gemmatimonadetes bacterium]|nr:rhodanese-like domain-containing protein [Gemmatimonadota bacterium]MCC6774652.1 rhodanese-like domain-containing protein [Gemmatimonadaceae bacterium]